RSLRSGLRAREELRRDACRDSARTETRERKSQLLPVALHSLGTACPRPFRPDHTGTMVTRDVGAPRSSNAVAEQHVEAPGRRGQPRLPEEPDELPEQIGYLEIRFDTLRRAFLL